MSHDPIALHNFRLNTSAALRNRKIVPHSPEFALHPLAVAPHIAKKANVEIVPVAAVAGHAKYSRRIKSLEAAATRHVHGAGIVEITIVDSGRMVAMPVPAVLR